MLPLDTKILITGGAGYLGRSILRRIQRGQLDWDVTVYSRDETKQDEARRRYRFARYVIGDVRDTERLALAAAGHELILHAAALKYIPEAELNPSEAIAVNVGGAVNVMAAARRAGVRRVIGVSTDKSCGPVNIYGATKMCMERLFAESSRYQAAGGPEFVCVRYGNVVGSTGSVIPLFQRQWQEQGTVRITNPNMTRFWMSAAEAVELVRTAEAGCRAGAIAIPPVSAMRILDVARAATADDVPVEIIGERPGEKQHEMLIHYEESVRVVKHEDPFFFELLPPGQAVGEAAFTLASHSPHHWISVEEMRAMIEDTQGI